MDFQDLWVEFHRPKTLKDLLLSSDVREFFEHLEKQEDKTIPHLLFIGPPGTGKTTLAKIIVNDILKCQYLYINASDQNSIDTVRGVITNFIQTKSIDGKVKVVILDEADGLSKGGGVGSSAQQALRNIMEEYSKYCRFIMTANYAHLILEPIMSRVQTFYVCPEQGDYFKRCLEILKQEKINLPIDQKPTLLKLIEGYYPDLRKCINELQKFSITGTFKPPENNIDQEILHISKKIFEMLINKEDVVDIRRYIIEKEKVFKADYQILLKNLFEEVYKSDLDRSKKAIILIIIGEALVNHQIVLDREINMFCCLIKILIKI
jgi:replication factor C small subunit